MANRKYIRTGEFAFNNFYMQNKSYMKIYFIYLGNFHKSVVKVSLLCVEVQHYKLLISFLKIITECQSNT